MARIIIILTLTSIATLQAQESDDLLHQVLEWATENTEEEVEWDISDFADALNKWKRKPIQLNTSSAIELVEWQILTGFQYSALQEHISKYGPLHSVLELQSISCFDTDLIRLLLAFCNTSTGNHQDETSFFDKIVHGKNELNLRYSRQWPPSKGYQTDTPAYEGSNERVQFRFRHTSHEALSFGFTLEKDAGERLITKSGTDYSSGFLYYTPKNRPYRIILGDYVFNTGQGLILNNGFGGNKNAPVASLIKTSRQIMPYRSSDENRFLRGAALEYQILPRLSFVSVFSKLARDGNLKSSEFSGTYVSSLQTSGLHRTESEIEDKDVVNVNRIGAVLKYTSHSNAVALTGLYTRLSRPLIPEPSLYNRYYFQGDKLWQIGLSYQWKIFSFYLFGESSFNPGAGSAHISGILFSPDKNISASIIGRYYGRRYHSLDANSFGENSQPNNEMGIYASTQIKFSPMLQWENSFDVWQHPWLRYRIYRPSKGHEWLSRMTYSIRRKLQCTLQFRFKSTEVTSDSENTPGYQVSPSIKWQTRLQFNLKLERDWEIRTRFEYLNNLTPTQNNGFLIAQDLHYSPTGKPWVIRARAALFNTTDYASRIYAYEQDLLYQYSVPAFSDDGSRYYLLIRYKGIRNLTLEMKFSETKYVSREIIGSGQDQKNGPVVGEIKFQLIYSWESVGKKTPTKNLRKSDISS